MNDFENRSELNGFDSVENKNETAGGTPQQFDSPAEPVINNAAFSDSDAADIPTSTPAEPENTQDNSFVNGEYHFNAARGNEEDSSAGQTDAGDSQHSAGPYSYTPPAGTYSAGNNSYGYTPNGSYNYGGFGSKPQPNYSAPVTQPPVKAEKPPKPPKAPKQKKNFGAGAVIAVALIAAIVGGSMGIGGYVVSDKLMSKDDTTAEASSTAADSGDSTTTNISINTTVDSVVEAVAEKCSPSVVGIRTTASVSSFLGNQESTGEGSGIIYSSDGYIITNYHVIEDAAENSGKSTTSIEVYLASDTSVAYDATIVGYNISYDLAVLKIDATGLPAMEMGDSNDLSVGQYVVAIGSPGGLSFMGSVSYGIISGLNRTLDSSSTTATSSSTTTTTSAEYIQTDAAINPGNSGGALVNVKGQLIGINSVKLVSESYEGMGFAIPVNKVLEICDNIIANKDQPTPYLGIEISTNYDSTTLQMYGYPAGAVISSVTDSSPADDAGLQRGDIITSFNGTTVSDYSDFNGLLNQCSAGETVSVTIYRSGRTYTTSVTLGSNG